MGLPLSVCAALAPALWTGRWVERAQQWGFVLGELLALTIAVTALSMRRAMAPARDIGDAARVRPK